MRDNERRSAIILSVIGIVPVVWLALLIAPSVKGGLPEILPSLMNVFNNPFHIEVCEDSVKTVLILLLCYGQCHTPRLSEKARSPVSRGACAFHRQMSVGDNTALPILMYLLPYIFNLVNLFFHRQL